MQIAVLVERVAGNGYRASGAEPFAVTVRASTREKALAKLREKIQARLKKGAELVNLDVEASAHPWMKFAGMFRDDPYFAGWQKAIAEYRQEVDEAPDYL